MRKNTRAPILVSQNRAGALNAAGVFNRKTSSTGNNRENKFQVEFKLQRADIAFYSLQKDTAAATSGKSIRWPENAQQGHTVVSKALFGIFFFFGIPQLFAANFTRLAHALLAALFWKGKCVKFVRRISTRPELRAVAVFSTQSHQSSSRYVTRAVVELKLLCYIAKRWTVNIGESFPGFNFPLQSPPPSLEFWVFWKRKTHVVCRHSVLVFLGRPSRRRVVFHFDGSFPFGRRLTLISNCDS